MHLRAARAYDIARQYAASRPPAERQFAVSRLDQDRTSLTIDQDGPVTGLGWHCANHIALRAVSRRAPWSHA